MEWEHDLSQEQLNALIEGEDTTNDDYDCDFSDPELLEIQRNIIGLGEQSFPPSSPGPLPHLDPNVLPSALPSTTNYDLQRPGTTGSSDGRNLSTSHTSPQTRPETPLSTSSASSHPLPTLKRPRADTEMSIRPRNDERNKSKKQAHHLPAADAALDNSETVQLHELLGLSDSDDVDIQEIEQEQIAAEQWLQARKEQERKDLEFARSLEAAWHDSTVSSSPNSSVPGHRNVDSTLMPPPAGQGMREQMLPSETLPSTGYLPSSGFGSSLGSQPRTGLTPNTEPAHSSRNYIDISSDSDLEEIGSYPRSTGRQNVANRSVSTNHVSAGQNTWQPIFPGSSNLGPSPYTPFDSPGHPYGAFDSLRSLGSGYTTPFYGNQDPMSLGSLQNYLGSSNASNYNGRQPGLGSSGINPHFQRGPAHPSSSSGHYARSQPVDRYDFLRNLPGPRSNPMGISDRYFSELNPVLGSAINKIRDDCQHGHVDPHEAKEELKNLLENIRPDQEFDLNREGTPDAMKFPLMEHQKLGLAWMKSMEEGSNKGGILADDMGLGKTIQALALMVTQQSTEPDLKTTLIITPVALLQQWKMEIQKKLKPGEHQMSVFILHGDKRSTEYNQLKEYDVVLTTFGTLSSELKRKEHWEKMKKENPAMFQDLNSSAVKLPVLGERSKWYRVILDEAQCIKNKNTKSAQACSSIRSTYRWCMSGTPMMNNVTELYSLINFLRIGPYNKLDRFNTAFSRPLKNPDTETYDRAMQKLQALLKAILLRRTKTSKIDGEPILKLPPRTTEQVHAVFSDDEKEFYKALETQSQLQFNKYLKAGTVGRNYSNVLVLLLRLRQCCCHPNLITDFAVEVNPIEAGIDLIANAKLLDSVVVARLKENENSECPVCMDAVENAIIFYPCGHSTCAECFARISDPTAGLAFGHDGSTAEMKCPNCRAKIDSKKVTDSSSFRKVFVTGEAENTEEDTAEVAEAMDSDDSDSDSGGLYKFVVNDDADVDSGVGEDGQSAMTKSKGKEKASGKGRKTLAVLKKEAQKNAKAKKKYLRRLEKTWEPSAKTNKAMEILTKIHNDGQGEKTIVFSQFTSMLDLLEVPIMREGWGYRRYDGSMKPATRNEAVDDFTYNPECTIMLVSLKAGNSGLNLVAASQVIIFDPFWNPYIEEQAVDRAHRIGQMRPVVVHRILVEGTVEDRILALQDKKRALIEGALDEKASGNISRLGTRELAFLFGVSHQ